jgi:hypothetical protein
MWLAQMHLRLEQHMVPTVGYGSRTVKQARKGPPGCIGKGYVTCHGIAQRDHPMHDAVMFGSIHTGLL